MENQTDRPEMSSLEQNQPEVSEPERPLFSPDPNPVMSVKPPQNKKPLIVALVLLALVAVAALLWFFVFNKSDNENQDTRNNVERPQMSEFIKPEYIVQLGNKVRYLDESGELVDLVTVDEKDKIIEAITKDDETELRYVTTAEDTNGSTVMSSYGSLTTQGKKELVKFPAGMDYYFSNPTLSPDSNTIVIERSGQDGSMESLVAYNLSDGTSKEAYKPAKDESAFYVMRGWQDDTHVFLQRQTCRQCDGPVKAELVSLDIETGKISPFYAADTNKLGYGTVRMSTDEKSLFVYGGDYSKGFDVPQDGVKYGSDYVVKINKQTGAAEQLAEIKGDNNFYNFVAGVGDKGIYLSSTTYIKTTDSNPLYGDAELGNFNPISKLQFVDGVTGSIRDVALESSRLKEKTGILNAVDTKHGLILMLSYDNVVGQGYNVVDTTIDILNLPLESESNEIKSLLQEKVKDTQSVRVVHMRR